jgi:hypothetical protein
MLMSASVRVVADIVCRDEKTVRFLCPNPQGDDTDSGDLIRVSVPRRLVSWWPIAAEGRAIVRGVIIAAALLVLGAGGALAHSWYDGECCADNDCKPIACDQIIEKSDGSYFDGMKFRSVRPSKDRNCHACIQDYHERGALVRYPRCLYVQQGS